MTMYCGEGVRLEKGLTLEELSEKSRVPCAVLLGLEAGRLDVISPNLLLNIAHALEVPVTKLLTDSTALGVNNK